MVDFCNQSGQIEPNGLIDARGIKIVIAMDKQISHADESVAIR